jgi:hypothetical protein
MAGRGIYCPPIFCYPRMANAVARAYKGVWGLAPVGSRGIALGQGDEVPLKLTTFCYYNCKFLKNSLTIFHNFNQIYVLKWRAVISAESVGGRSWTASRHLFWSMDAVQPLFGSTQPGRSSMTVHAQYVRPTTDYISWDGLLNRPPIGNNLLCCSIR